jgi:hypothetical protein
VPPRAEGARSLTRCSLDASSILVGRHFDNVVRAVVVPALEGAGFGVLSRSRFRRVTHGGLRHLVILDPRPSVRQPQHLRVMLVVNSLPVDNDEGGYLVRYFTGGSISDDSRGIPADGPRLEKALQRLVSQFAAVVEPWFSGFTTPQHLAAAVPDSDLDFYRAQLFMQAGDRTAARTEAESYLARVSCLALSEADRRAAWQSVAMLLKD